MNTSRRDPNSMNFLEHLAELRARILKCITAVLIMMGISLFYAGDFRNILVLPVGSAVYLSPPEAFLTDVKLALTLGTALASPYIFYQGWQFVLPALNIIEKRYAILLSLASILLFAGGILFAYHVVVPVLIAFFLGFGDEKLAPMFSISRYISMVLGMTLASGLVFELPLVVLFLAKLDLITSTDLRKRRGYAVVMIFVIAAVLSPPDVFSQLLLALPLMGLYELSILLTRIIFR